MVAEEGRPRSMSRLSTAGRSAATASRDGGDDGPLHSPRVVEFAVHLGIDLNEETDKKLVWIAKQAVNEALPEGWSQVLPVPASLPGPAVPAGQCPSMRPRSLPAMAWGARRGVDRAPFRSMPYTLPLGLRVSARG